VDIAQNSDLAHFLGDLCQSEKLFLYSIFQENKSRLYGHLRTISTKFFFEIILSIEIWT
jgi:hypothetical protein